MDEIGCPQCRMVNPASAAFCSRCGAALASGSAPGTPGAAPGASGWELATAGMSQPAPYAVGAGPLRKEELAGWWQRFGGYLLDGLILMVPILVLWGVLALLAWLVDPGVFGDIGDALAYETMDFSDGVYVVLGLGVLATLALAIGWEVGWTRSSHMARPGQSIAGFRVVKVDGIERLSTGRAFGRFAAKLIYNLGDLGWIPTIVTAFTIGLSEKKQGLHDMMAGTACVRRSALALRGVGPDARFPSQQTPGYPPVVGGSWPPPSAPMPTMPPPGTPPPGPSGPFA